MMKIGLVGEDPSDTSSLKNLLEQRFPSNVRFVPLIRRMKGCQLDGEKFRKVVELEANNQKCDVVICIRDLDGFESQRDKVSHRNSWFQEIEKRLICKGVLLLNIWELEALIYGDIETFNRSYRVSINAPGDPSMIKEPKERLKYETRKAAKQFKESHCPDLFKALRYQVILNKCRFFAQFVEELEKLIA